MKKRIGFDLTYITDKSATGIKKHGEEMIEGIVKIKNDNYEIIIFVDADLKEEYENKFPKCYIIPIKFYFKNVRYVKRINMFNLIKRYIIKKSKCDLLIYPYINMYSAIMKKQNKIVSILDTIPLDEIEDKTSKQYYKVEKNIIDLMNKFETVITLSEYSKKRLLETNRNYNGQIKVIPTSVKKIDKSNKNVKELIETDKKYILSINSFFRHKNQITLVKAFNRVKDQTEDNLVFVRKTRA